MGVQRRLRLWRTAACVLAVVFVATVWPAGNAAEAPTLPACEVEDQVGCVWDCATMGNRVCGPGVPRFSVIWVHD